MINHIQNKSLFTCEYCVNVLHIYMQVSIYIFIYIYIYKKHILCLYFKHKLQEQIYT